jgi:hypothetical protein
MQFVGFSFTGGRFVVGPCAVKFAHKQIGIELNSVNVNILHCEIPINFKIINLQMIGTVGFTSLTSPAVMVCCKNVRN